LLHSVRILLIGVGLLFGSISLDLAGTFFRSLPVLILSFALGIAGALVAIRGIIEFVSERV
jgi:hypothetical protein